MPNFLEKIWRNQIYLIFSCFFMILLIIMFFVNGLGVYEYVGDQILIMFTLLNMYTIYMQYMYTITKVEVEKLEGAYVMAGGNSGKGRDEVETIISNFGNEDVILDLDSDDGGMFGSSVVEANKNKNTKENFNENENKNNFNEYEKNRKI
jgi:hypothetical protein